MLKEPAFVSNKITNAPFFRVFLTNIYYWKRIDVAAERSDEEKKGKNLNLLGEKESSNFVCYFDFSEEKIRIFTAAFETWPRHLPFVKILNKFLNRKASMCKCESLVLQHVDSTQCN